MLSRKVRQDILERTTAAIFDQGSPSIEMGGEGGSECRYRGLDGNRCALGHLISDRHYRPELEGSAIQSLLVVDAICNSLELDASEITGDDTTFLDRLQQAHDDAALSTNDDEAFLVRWEGLVRRLCKMCELRFPEEIFES